MANAPPDPYILGELPPPDENVIPQLVKLHEISCFDEHTDKDTVGSKTDKTFQDILLNHIEDPYLKHLGKEKTRIDPRFNEIINQYKDWLKEAAKRILPLLTFKKNLRHHRINEIVVQGDYQHFLKTPYGPNKEIVYQIIMKEIRKFYYEALMPAYLDQKEYWAEQYQRFLASDLKVSRPDRAKGSNICAISRYISNLNQKFEILNFELAKPVFEREVEFIAVDMVENDFNKHLVHPDKLDPKFIEDIVENLAKEYSSDFQLYLLHTTTAKPIAQLIIDSYKDAFHKNPTTPTELTDQLRNNMESSFTSDMIRIIGDDVFANAIRLFTFVALAMSIVGIGHAFLSGVELGTGEILSLVGNATRTVITIVRNLMDAVTVIDNFVKQAINGLFSLLGTLGDFIRLHILIFSLAGTVFLAFLALIPTIMQMISDCKHKNYPRLAFNLVITTTVIASFVLMTFFSFVVLISTPLVFILALIKNWVFPQPLDALYDQMPRHQKDLIVFSRLKIAKPDRDKTRKLIFTQGKQTTESNDSFVLVKVFRHGYYLKRANVNNPNHNEYLKPNPDPQRMTKKLWWVTETDWTYSDQPHLFYLHAVDQSKMINSELDGSNHKFNLMTITDKGQRMFLGINRQTGDFRFFNKPTEVKISDPQPHRQLQQEQQEQQLPQPMVNNVRQE
ncbi:hypothetical protein PPL_03106 [Heterostelium album PN500]|uniref:Uncharacterized protein n=1 Tax=Heterostelium pallidum (strain ATCC 26659 / Pp 5 / PN500) TaxID=670386 RepID=D3B3Y5_HETP5|nr:hypothetical protein PPL_03106 [Heterostelium album PN500]EFA84033.1 hypothetical protein PPL_03106 [Heterostelium album PN500]|eukprot:XP_020436150.1 hypothetical protein PPL_03106 [Heterostelium album PN500]